ncbi:baculoviral IAP repeat-containing protein 6 isoform X1 [Pieris brassicae]|uniref:UBC core domain-containing protein n=1 Tax=Pieris brassicae TaxID=7116 RepID=A0A9P0XB40_PIEBR|nr:baculoviral IAP repeat-containing protein 6 isoform X1 [Pieris brassicae]CAH4031478.1 unnamed protein product [Pieris brassicae]
MGDDSLILREDGYIRMNFPVTSLTYHSNLNIILVKTDVGGVHVLDVNSGVILQSSCLSADDDGTLGVEYAAGADRVFVWDKSGVGARTDYNGVLLLHTALQRPLSMSQPDTPIRIELVLSEAVLLYQCVQSLDAQSIEGLQDFINELKTAIDAEPVRKGVKAQKWSTVTITLSQSTLRLVMVGIVQELKGQNRRIPALSIASAVGQRANELMPCNRDEESRALMYSEAERKETFKRWPHMDYKWALPARMAQAGFYHQPSPSGDDRAMCFTCMVCLVCWEKSDEPWVEHERHSPNCPFVRGEYTHNVPISVTNATACAVPCPNVKVVSKGNTGDLIATGTSDGKGSIWKFDCGLKLRKLFNLSPYDSIFSGILTNDSHKVWSASLEKDSSTYGIELTAMTFIGLASQQETYPQAQHTENVEKETNDSNVKPALVCAVIVTRTTSAPTTQPIKEDSSKALFDSGDPEKSKENIQAMNDQNEAKNNLTCTNKMLFLLTYDIHHCSASSMTTVIHTSNSSGNSKPGGSKKVCPLQRTDDTNIYDDIFFQYSDDDTELPHCTNIEEQISNVFNIEASSSKEDCKPWEPKKIIFTKHLKVLPPPPPTALLPELPEAEQSMLDYVGKFTQLKSWKSGNLESVGTKVVDQTDAVQGDSITDFLTITGQGPLQISDLKWYEGIEPSEKIKLQSATKSKAGTQTVLNVNPADGFDSDIPAEETVSQGIAIQCLGLPATLNIQGDAKVTHLLPSEDKQHLLVVVSSIEPDKFKAEEEMDADGDIKMDVDEVSDQPDKIVNKNPEAYFLYYKINNKTSTYTLEDNPVTYKELPYSESPVDLCLLPVDKNDQYSIASVSVDGHLRLYSLPDFSLLSEKQVPKGQFISVAYCASVERLSVSTKHGMIYFYALNNGEKDVTGESNEDDFANIDFEMLQRAPRDDTDGPVPPPVILANKTDFDDTELSALLSLTGSYCPNPTVPYSAVVPGFWCELSPAQRSRSDHQNNRSWRLQNTSSTWDEHVLELTLPYNVSLAHIEFGFTLHSANTVNLPIIQVTLLKQNLHGIGYNKDASFGQRSDSPLHFSVIDADVSNLENPVNSEEYLQAHNAEILAGPLLLSSGLDMSQQSGTLILTSPRLYRARGRTFLIHIKTLFDPAKEINKGPIKSGESSGAKKSSFIGCDWLHQISITVRSTPHTDVPLERQQRIAMLESNSFLSSLCEIAVSKVSTKKRKIALDILSWVISIRLQRMRLAKNEKSKDKDVPSPVEMQQLECISVIEKHTDALLKKCILCANRSIAKKCAKIILTCSDGVKQLPRPWKCTFENSLTSSVIACIPLLGACESPGAVKWLMALAQYATCRTAAPELVARCLALLEKAARCLRERSNPYHQLLRARFGLYGLALERSIFSVEIPELGRSSSLPLTYAGVLTGDVNASPSPKQESQLRDLLNMSLDTGETKTTANNSQTHNWCEMEGGLAALTVVGESLPLHVSCHVASDGTKLDTAPTNHPPPVVSAHTADSNQLWSVVKEGHAKQTSKDENSGGADGSMMDCDPQDRPDVTEDKLLKDQDQCGIPWAALVTRPPQQTLIVERMHSGARRYIVLDFGYAVRLTDIIIPSCSDLVTLGIDTWTVGEETDCVKLAFATDIATKHLVLADIQPPLTCRYMKITTIGRYGMSAMKCRIPLGWFYGEIAEVSNLKASTNALNALHEDLSCRFRLATGKLIDLLNPYLELYNGNAAHMMAYLNQSETDIKVVLAYQECIELQQQLHNCTNILKKLLNTPDCSETVLDAVDTGQVLTEVLLDRASTDKLRVITESVVDLLLYFLFQMSDVQYEEVTPEWCRGVIPLAWEWGGRSGAAVATLLARLCGAAHWWGPLLADRLTTAFDEHDAPPLPLDRCLVSIMYMSRKSMYAQCGDGGVTQALASRTLDLLRSGPAPPALLAALLSALAHLLDAAIANTNTGSHNRWDWVTGGRVGGGCAGNGSGARSSTPVQRSGECKLHRRKLHKRLLNQMQEMEAARRGIQVAIEQQQRARLTLKAHMALMGKRSNSANGASTSAQRPSEEPRILSPTLASALAQALLTHILTIDSIHASDHLLLCAKVVGRVCALCGGCGWCGWGEAGGVLALARRAVTLPPWPRHALTALLQDLVEFECGEPPVTTTSSEEWHGPSSSRIKTKLPVDPNFGKAPKKELNYIDYQLTQLIESDDSESEEKLEQHFIDVLKKAKKNKESTDLNTSTLSSCVDARLENGPAAAAEVTARRVLAATALSLPAALRSPPHRASPLSPAPASPQSPASPSSPSSPPARHNPPLAHTLYDVFRHLALEFKNQVDCTFMENVVSLWLTLNGSSWGNNCSSGWSLAALTVPADAPRIRFASDTVVALLESLTELKNISLRCWVLSMQALAWVASFPIQTEGNTQTIGRVILDCEYFVPALVKFVSIDIASDGAVVSSEPYLGGSTSCAGAGAAGALQAVISRVVMPRGGEGALCSLRALCALSQTPGALAHHALDLHAALLRAAHSLLPSLSAKHTQHALPLIEAIADQCSGWVWWGGGWRSEGWNEGRNSGCGGLLADVLAGAGAARKPPHRRAVLASLLLYCRKLLALPLPSTRTDRQDQPASPESTTSGGSVSGSEECQTDESKQQQQQQQSSQEGTNVEDERKQVPKSPCLADTVLQHPEIMEKFYRTLSMCDGMTTMVLNSSGNVETSSDQCSLKEEIFWLVAHIPTVAANPALMLPSLIEYLSKDEVVHLSQAMQQLLQRLLDKPELLAAFIDAGGMELAVRKLNICHQAGPSSSQGLVSSLMNHLKLPPQLMNLSTPVSSSKKIQPPAVEATDGLINIAPFCTVTCGNPTAQAADVLLGTTGESTRGGGGACAARRVRAATWSYHFFSADDASIALSLHLPYAVRLHEVQLQPHLTSLATCPGAVGVEAGCGGTLAPLGPPQSTAGMTFIRLAIARPVVCTTVLLRLYRPRDCSNMGLLQLRLLAAPAFAPQPPIPTLPPSSDLNNTTYTSDTSGNNWASVICTCVRGRASASIDIANAVRALCGALLAGGPQANHAHQALLAAARAQPELREPLMEHLLDLDAHAHAYAFQPTRASTSRTSNSGSMSSVCGVVQALCRTCAPGTLHAFLRWLPRVAERALRTRAAPSAAILHTLAAVLWSTKEENLLDDIEELITDDVFELICTWVKEVSEASLLKKSLDAVMCSMCFIRPDLFKMLLERMEIPMDTDESMEAQTDDTKVRRPMQASVSGESGIWVGGSWPAAAAARRLRRRQLTSIAAAAMSPACTLTLLHSPLPNTLMHAVADFCEAKLDQIISQSNLSGDIDMIDISARELKGDMASMDTVCDIVEWARLMCAERRFKDWLGAAGSGFWKPLLKLLCHPRQTESSWREMSQYAKLEEHTIRLFSELTVCHSHNQKLFASTLHNILDSMHCTGPEGISGFTRSLILRLVLSGERATVALRWAGGSAPPSTPSAVPSPPAPCHPAARAHAILTLPLHTTVRTLLAEHRPPMPVMEEGNKLSSHSAPSSSNASVLRSASDPAIMTVAEAWELSLAAASASKDKRVKDVKNTTLKQQSSKKRQSKPNADSNNPLAVMDDLLESSIRVQANGIEGFIPGNTTLAQLCTAVPHEFGPHLTLTLHLNTTGEASSGPMWEGGGASSSDCGSSRLSGGAVLREFGACGGLALVAARLPRPHAAPLPAPARQHHSLDLDWVKLDDAYELSFQEVMEIGVTSAGNVAVSANTSSSEESSACAGVPSHALVALALLLKLRGYAHALLEEGSKAVHLLRLLLGVAHDEDGRSIVVSGSNSSGVTWSLGTLPFRVVARLLESGGRGTDGRVLRDSLLRLGAVRLVLACLAVFTHHKPASTMNASSNGTGKEDKSQLYWAKGTGFGTGSTQQTWDVEQALVRQRIEEEHVTVLLQVLSSYMNPGEKWPPEEGSQEAQDIEETEEGDTHHLPAEFIDLVANSSLLPAICSYLRNDSVLDMSRHIPLYVCVLRVARALASLRCRRLARALRPLPALLHSMSRTTNSYATKLRMSKKNIFGKMTYSQRFSTSSNSELSEEDEGLASLIADIQATSALMCRSESETENVGVARSVRGASREARYIELMRTMQFETFEMIAEEAEGGFRFTVPYHFEGTVRAAGERTHPARMKRLAQEAATLATSLPLSYSSSVFVRTDTDRLDVMKVLITGPSDTPYANGCFVLDVYFPAEYPAVPMLINLETTGRHSVRFNPNLYNDGKVCLSVLNTWHGRPEEKWNSHTSSFLQVLVSIQSLILVPEPYFNEPGYERSRGTRVGNSASLEYNSNIYQACVRWAMLDHLRSPEPCFKEVIQTHFWIKRNEIMQTVANWITELEGQTGDERTQRTIHLNLMALKRHYVKLQEELARLPVPPGLEELDEPFQLPAAPAPPPAPAQPPPVDIDHDMEKIVAQILE